VKLEYILFKKLINININSLPLINLSSIKDNNLLNNLNYFILDNPSLKSYKDYLLKLLLNFKFILFKRYIFKIDSNNKIIYKASNLKCSVYPPGFSGLYFK
jgi:hypothetical protein